MKVYPMLLAAGFMLFGIIQVVSEDVNNFASPIDGSKYPQTNESGGFNFDVNDIPSYQDRTLTSEESLVGDSLAGPIVVLRSGKNDKYVRVDEEHLFATSTSATNSEEFYLIRVDGGVALKSVATGCYVCNPKYVWGSYVIRCPNNWDDYYKSGLNPAGLFKMECNGRGGWSFLARNGNYVCVREHGMVEASTSSPEYFQIEIQDQPIQKAIDAIGPGGTFKLNEGVYKGNVVIDKPVNLIGVGSDKTFVDGDENGSVFTIGGNNSDIDVKLTGITIQGGSSEIGGGINNYGRLVIEDSIITGNVAEFGGGIFNHNGTSTVTINRVNIIGNSVTYDGAGVYNSVGTLIINGGNITENKAEVGAGVFNDLGQVIMKDGNITKNIATQRCGGILNDGSLDFEGGSVVKNTRGNVYTVPP